MSCGVIPALACEGLAGDNYFHDFARGPLRRVHYAGDLNQEQYVDME